MKESKSLSRFMKQAKAHDCHIASKTEDEIEKLFWKTLKNSSPVYGADVSGSMFDKGIPWNLNEITSLLNDGLKGCNITGVTAPYCYIGTWKAMFGWHKEDMDLYSINYLHKGMPKFWYSVDLDSND